MSRGGARSGAGRKPGSPSPVTQKKRAAKQAKVKETVAKMEARNTTPLDIFRRVMEGDTSVTDLQLEAAKACAPYVHARLSAVTMNATVRRNITDFSDDELAAIAGTGQEGRTD